jgi:hypothetical protein
MNSGYDAVVGLVENRFDMVVDRGSITALQRPYDHHLLTLKFSTATHETYFLKESHHHSPEHLQVVFSALETIRNHPPQLSFPLCTNDGAYHFSDSNERHFQLLTFLDLAPFDPTTVSLERLFGQLAGLHLNLSRCQVPSNRYSDLPAYVVLGLRRIQKRYGADLPFLPRLESFINRLPLGSLRQGGRHGDIQETNVCLQGADIVFVDADNVHLGYPLMDTIQGAVIYLDQAELCGSANQAVVEQVWQQVKGEAEAITRRDVRYLLARVMLGPIQGGELQPSKAALNRFLLDLECFCEDGE